MKKFSFFEILHIKFPALAVFFVFFGGNSFSQPLRVGIAGLTHDHVHGILQHYKKGEVQIIGIAEADQQLAQRYKKNYNLPDSIFYPSLQAMLDRVKPEAVLAFNAIAEHRSVVEICAPRKIPVMVEKPLATTDEDASRMAKLARDNGIPLITNYETTWYPTNHQVYDIVYNQNSLGDIRKIVVHSGHQGPKEIGCSPDFLGWLTDPVKNGGGALIDFGCYGANLMTWLMKGKAPIAVTAVTKRIKPAIYPKVDDDATILLEYPDAVGIIEASWNWPYGIKDMEVFGQKGYLHALNGNDLERRDSTPIRRIEVKPAPYKDYLSYLTSVLRGQPAPANDLSSLENNIVVVKILSAARKSASEGKRVEIK